MGKVYRDSSTGKLIMVEDWFFNFLSLSQSFLLFFYLFMIILFSDSYFLQLLNFNYLY
jgi:hypothetical protein